MKPVIVYDNPVPALRSRHGYFPCLAQAGDASLYCSFMLGEAFESVDGESRLMRSTDGGKTWELLPPVINRPGVTVPTTSSFKITFLKDGRALLFGYETPRPDPDTPVGNPETGGLLDDDVVILWSTDGCKTFTPPQSIPCAWGPHVEASAPLYELKDGVLATPITGFPDWNGKTHGRNCGRLLRSDDGGKTFTDDVVCMEFPGDEITCYEQRMTQTDSGALVVIGWNENMRTGERLRNHYTISTDGGKTFSEPRDTGVLGQASSVTALGGERVLAIHAIRRDTDRPGIYGYVVDVSGGGWKKESEPVLLWEPATPMVKDTTMAEIFSFLKFGQPNATRLADGRVIMTHWAVENGQGRVYATEINF